MTSPSELHQEALLGFDGTVYRFNGGYEISIDISRVLPTPEMPHGYRYSFVLRGPGRNDTPAGRILAYDNAHAPKGVKRPFDHAHKTKRGPGGAPVRVDDATAISVMTIDDLLGRFIDECFRELLTLGVDVDSVREASLPERAQERGKARFLKRKGAIK